MLSVICIPSFCYSCYFTVLYPFGLLLASSWILSFLKFCIFYMLLAPSRMLMMTNPKACFSKHSQWPPKSFRLAGLESLCCSNFLPWMSEAIGNYKFCVIWHWFLTFWWKSYLLMWIIFFAIFDLSVGHGQDWIGNVDIYLCLMGHALDNICIF